MEWVRSTEGDELLGKQIGIFIDSDGHRVFPLLDLPGSPETWAHCGESSRGGQFPACRFVTWSVDGYDATPLPDGKLPVATEPTFRDEDLVAFEGPENARRFAWRWRQVAPSQPAP